MWYLMYIFIVVIASNVTTIVCTIICSELLFSNSVQHLIFGCLQLCKVDFSASATETDFKADDLNFDSLAFDGDNECMCASTLQGLNHINPNGLNIHCATAALQPFIMQDLT